MESNFSQIDSTYSNSSSKVNPEVELFYSTQEEYDKVNALISKHDSNNSSSIFIIIVSILFGILVLKQL